MKNVDIVLHCASYIEISPDNEKTQKLLNVNIGGTKNVLRACKENQVPFLIYTSSMEVAVRKHQFYQITGDESLPTYSSTSDYGYLYGYTKSVSERLVLDANDYYVGTDNFGRPLKLMTCALRPVPIYGGRSDKYGIGDLLKRAKNLGGMIPRIGWNPNPYQTVYVGNVAWAHVKAMETFRENPENIAGKPYFVTDDTPALAFHKVIEPYLSAFGYRLTGIAIPFTFLYCLLFFFEIIAWILKPIYPLRMSLSRYGTERLYYGHTFSRDNLHKDTGYTSYYTQEECFKRTVSYYVANPPK